MFLITITLCMEAGIHLLRLQTRLAICVQIEKSQRVYLRPQATTVSSSQRTHHLRGLRKAIHGQRPSQLVVARGHINVKRYRTE